MIKTYLFGILLIKILIIQLQAFKLETNSISSEIQNLKYYQLYQQCDKKWADVKIGTSDKKICDDGSLLTTIAMIVAGLPVWWADPGVLNQWLIENNGFENKDSFVWKSIEKLGFKYGGMSNNTRNLKNYLNTNYSVFANVKNQSHWAMVTAINDNQTTVILYDPVRNITGEDVSNIRTYGWYQKIK